MRKIILAISMLMMPGAFASAANNNPIVTEISDSPKGFENLIWNLKCESNSSLVSYATAGTIFLRNERGNHSASEVAVSMVFLVLIGIVLY